MNPLTPAGESGLPALRRLVSGYQAVERCELCAANLGKAHQHLIEPRTRRLVCACDACAILFNESGVTKYRRLPRDVRLLTEFQMSDAFWNALAIPIGLVFLLRWSESGQVTALYPSAAGCAESGLDDEIWSELMAMNPVLETLRPDIEGLLVNRLRGAREYFIVPVDQCYRLTGLIRKDWRGFSGGEQAWSSIDGFFADLKNRARVQKAGDHA
jgi:hypothetical protein